MLTCNNYKIITEQNPNSSRFSRTKRLMNAERERKREREKERPVYKSERCTEIQSSKELLFSKVNISLISCGSSTCS